MPGLAAFAILLSTTRALRGKTDAGQSVLVAPRESIKITTPMVAVFTSNGMALPKGRDLADAEGMATIRFEIYIPSEARITDGNVTLDMVSSASGELVLSAMWNEIARTLCTDPDPWPELWRSFVLRIKKFDFSSNVFETKEGSRVAMRAIDLQCETLSEPITGRPATGAWAQLLDYLTQAGDPESLALSAFMKHKIETNVAGVWQVQSAALGVGVDKLGEIRSGPLQWLSGNPIDQ
jgi:hypothetical protein